MPGALLGTREHTEFIHIGFILHGERKTEVNGHDVRLGQAEGWGQGSNWKDKVLAEMVHSAFETATAEPPKGQKNSQDGEWGTDMKDSWL